MKSIALEDRFVSDARQLIGAKRNVLLAISGGADSVAMLHLFHLLRNELKLQRVGVAHVNHGLRGRESEADAEFVKRHAERYALCYYEKRLGGKSLESCGIEAWARHARYAYFQELLAAHSYDAVATAHTANDQAETILMRITRGTGIKGLCGIKPGRKDAVIRPMLHITRAQIEQWLAKRGHPFRTDQTNADTRYTRNRIRAGILADLELAQPGSIVNIAELADQAEYVWAQLEPELSEWRRQYTRQTAPEAFAIDKSGCISQTHAR
ncbi:MAG: tRNA lysidine(34) synthetase TilS [Chitinivibrionales bacterium]|nr:tRNA lysidine(34) synthetase TilS [Chitinivibrionales bacterium]